MMLAPASTFNPTTAWIAAKKKEEEEALKPGSAVASKTLQKKEDKIKMANSEKRAQETLIREITRIRNCAGDVNKLKQLLRDTHSADARRVLIVEILKKALENDKKKLSYEDTYEALWAVEKIGYPRDFTAPKPSKSADLMVPERDSRLVYDNVDHVQSCVEEAKKKMEQDRERMIEIQLVKMSDRLPPLSKFTFGYSLDPWQKRVLRWIDAGRSVLICAPTSSGKTVLSSYVAFIASKLTSKADKKGDDSKHGGGAAAAAAEDDYEDLGGDDDGSDGSDVDEEEGEEQEQDDEPDASPREPIMHDLSTASCRGDRLARSMLRKRAVNAMDAKSRVLFVVPTEPLVWQVGAYFSKLLREEGDTDTKVAIVSDTLVYHPVRKLGVMPQIVVGTPFALENALTKSRGLCAQEVYGRTSQINLPGGFDHFDWVIYDEVHSLDGTEGAALQRLIRSMNCKFLALSATVGNADQLRRWMETVKGEHLDGVEVVDVIEDEVMPPLPPNGGPMLAIQVTLTTVKRSVTINTLSEGNTVGDLKKAISLRCPSLPSDQQQLVFKGLDLVDEKSVLGIFGFKIGELATVAANTHVNLLYHQGRFINLQRYVWQNGKLADLNPLGAVQTIESLQGGILDNSSLSFTSKDSYTLWKKIEELFPADAVEELNPRFFFGTDEQITLQRTKEYEDKMKMDLKKLSVDYPKETQELLYSFRLEDPPKEFDICELVISLKEKDMLPCLPFHLNAFEAIRLFQGLVAGLEYRQKQAHPTYYSDLKKEKEKLKKEVDQAIKNAGKNKKEEEEKTRTGEIPMGEDLTVNEWAPHPNFTFCRVPLSEKEFTVIADEMERFDGFEKRDGQAMKDKPGQSEKILGHALVRGLRRGIGLFLEEVAFPYYRRAVMNLASQGKLGVIISDDSLAFGVNMPFRTCVFCGEMYDRDLRVPRLTPLMAQQMSGRAGRRGLDTQGNLVYAGARASFIRTLMIGEVSNTTGEKYDPRYPTIFLQSMLSPRHVGFGRVEVVGKRTLKEFTQELPEREGYALETSRRILEELHFIKQVDNKWVPDEDYEHNYPSLSMIWELRKTPQESLTLGRLLPEIVAEFKPMTAGISIRGQTGGDKGDGASKVEGVVFTFLACLTIIVGRCPASEGGLVLHENPWFEQGDRRAMYEKWYKLFADTQADFPERLAHLRDTVGPFLPDGSPMPLDGTLFQCLLDRNFVHTLSDDAKQTIKGKLWHLGEVLKNIHNSLWPNNNYYTVLALILRTSFKKIQYVNTELLAAVINFPNVASLSRESRTEGETKKSAAGVPEKAGLWSDCTEVETTEIRATPWTSAIGTRNPNLIFCIRSVTQHPHTKIQQTNIVGAAERLKKMHETAASVITADLTKMQRIFVALKSMSESDHLLMKLVAYGRDDVKEVAAAMASCTPARVSSQHNIGALTWFCFELRPTAHKRFPMYLKELYDTEKVDEAAILTWHKATVEASSSFLPERANVTAESLTKAKECCNAFITWLQEMEEEEDDEED